MIYLASPHSDPDPAVQEQRFEAVCKAAADLMQNGFLVFSPIVHSHPISKYGLPTDWEFWKKYDEEMLSFCSAFWIYTLPGWKESKGVGAEFSIASKLRKPIVMWSPGTTASQIREIRQDKIVKL